MEIIMSKIAVTSPKIKKALKRAYDNAWREEPVWELRKKAGQIARKAVFDFIMKELT
jgi:hypothetical protein